MQSDWHWRLARGASLAMGGALLALGAARGQSLLISEIMYHPASTNLLEEWVELYNPGTSTVDLGGWRISQGVSFVFPTNATLPANHHLVVAADRATFLSRYPTVTNFVAGWVGTLSHDGGEIRLEDALGNTVNSVSYAPEGDWAVRQLGAPDPLNRQGWEWFAEHDGLGKSLELVNRNLSNAPGQNWASSTVAGGTPGSANSAARTNIAPLILDVSRFPIVPRSADPVTIAARILDERSNGLTVTLFWRVDGAVSFTTATMLDDGLHGDGLASDGVFGSTVPTHPDGTIVEFYLTARDLENNLRTFPNVVPSGTSRTANLSYQVDNSVYAGDQPLMRLILTQAEYSYLATQVWGGEPFSDALVNGTFINTDGVLEGGTTTQVRYNCGFRNRGHGTRTAVPHNFHVAFPKDRTWKGRNGLNLNTHYTHSQQIGSAVFRRLELPMADSRPVQVRLNAANLAKPGQEQFGSYAANEVVDGRLVQRQFPLDGEGNLYRGIRDLIPGISADADLVWHGPSYTSYTNAYAKENNAAANDWSDLIHLIDVLNHTPDANYAAAVAAVANVDEWMKYFAANTLFDNQENSLGIGSGDDFSLYRGTNDTRFLLLPYDLDSLMGRGLVTTSYADGLWRMTNVAAINRFMKEPEFVPLYFKHLKALAETAFSPEQMNPLLDHLLSSYLDATTLRNLKTFNSNHVAYVLSQFPQELTVSHSLGDPVNGYPHTTTATLALHGTGNAIHTRSVQVNGVASSWTAWQGTWTNNSVALRPGLNRVLVQALGTGGVEVGRTNIDIWYDDGGAQSVGGSVSTDTLWTAAGGPYDVTAALTVNPGATLTIEPGTTVYLGSGVDFTVASGGRLLAEGTATAPIRFTRAPGAATTWGGIVIDGGAGTPETRLAYAHLEFNGTTAIHSSGGTVFLDHLTYGSTDHPYLSLDGSSFIVSACVFPSPTTGFEPVHGTGGVKSGGHGIFVRNFFGTPMGYNDVIDFTGGNRPAGALVQFLDNVFTGASDDMLDLDGTDAWVEGNLFLHAHKNGSPDSSSAVSGGNDSGNTSEITIVGNIFYDCDHAATAKQGNFYTLINNTIVHQTKVGGLDTDAAVINLADEGTTEGSGMYLEGNLLYDVEKLVRNLASARVTFTNNLMSLPWSGPGGGNSAQDPLLTSFPQLSETHFSTWQQAQVMRTWFGLQAGSPARGTGPNGRDQGGVIPIGASVSGEPAGTTSQTSAALTVGVNRTGSGIPTAGFPSGSGYTHYRWRLDADGWSPETLIGAPITLTGLTDGTHYVEVSGRRDPGLYQDDPVFGADAVVTGSRTWIVDRSFIPPAKPTLRINEVLARNVTTLTNLGTTPDLIELYNEGPQPVDLSGMGLTDSATTPYRFTFPPGTTLAGGAFLVLLADSGTGGPYLHTGFSLKASGDDVYLYDKPAGAGLLDSVVFGLQLEDSSIGRRTDGTWGLCRPTFGAGNIAQRTGDLRTLKINEWLADAQFVAPHDFVELYNPDPLPVALGGLFLSDAAGSPARHPIAPLSFIGDHGFTGFIADSDPGQGPDHLSFRLSPDVGLILLSAPDLTLIDAVNYGPQHTDVSEGRSPNGADTFAALAPPTPGGGNPGTSAGGATIATTTVPLLPLTASWQFNQTGNLDGVAWWATGYNDAAWPGGPALLGVESSTLPAPGIRTSLTLGRTTYYFRTRFVADTNLAGFNLNIATVLDDGAIVYLNGARILTNGMSTGTPSDATLSSRNVDNAVTEFFTVPGTALVGGTNVLAAEVHQTSTGSSDIVWGMALDASRTVTNYAPGVLVPVVLNEVLAPTPSSPDPGSSTIDYVELYNPSTNAVDLAAMSLTDDPAFGRKWVFPPGSTLAAGAYQVISCNASQPVSATNTGFGLAASGGAVFFFNTPASGGALIDAVRYGLQTPDFSVGRIPNGSGTWTLNLPSPGTANTAAGLASVSGLRINEWMADPASGSDWFELFNSASQPVALGGLCFTDNLADRTQSPLPPLSFIGIGANAFVQFVADGNAGAGADHVSFSLKKSGEALGIFSPSGVMLDGIAFGLQLTGVSGGRFPDGGPNLLSFTTTPSPAESNYLPLDRAAVNEVLTHTDPPLEDAVELFNATAAPVNIGGWYLSNSKTDFKKFRIPDGTVLGANSFTVIYETNFNTGSTAFTFNSAHGDAAILSEADASGNLTGYRSEVKFGAAENGVSFGRYQTSVGMDFTALSARTFGVDTPASVAQFRTGTGLPNAYPKVGPVVVSEILYRSLTNGVENPDDEFIELQNLTTGSVPLFDPAYPTNTWRLRDAVDFEFPTNVTLAAGDRLLVVGFDPANTALLAAFRDRFGVPAGVAVLGPWTGRLADDNHSVELVKPDAVQLPPHPDAGYVPQVLVDKVRYSALAPWPTTAAGGSHSLQRTSLGAYGNDPVNWFAAAPTAGRVNTLDPADVNGDGLPDAWQIQYFGSISTPEAAPGADPDGDGLTNLQEYLAGTSPTDPNSVLKLESTVDSAGTPLLHFTAVANKTYTVQYRDSLTAGSWLTLTDVDAAPVNGPVDIPDPNATSATRFYRLATPALR